MHQYHSLLSQEFTDDSWTSQSLTHCQDQSAIYECPTLQLILNERIQTFPSELAVNIVCLSSVKANPVIGLLCP